MESGIKLNKEIANLIIKLCLSINELKKYCKLDDESMRFLVKTGQKMSITARSYSRILKVSRTIADMDNAKNIELKHVLESLQYRSLERLKAFLG